jgi:hypothetical protein
MVHREVSCKAIAGTILVFAPTVDFVSGLNTSYCIADGVDSNWRVGSLALHTSLGLHNQSETSEAKDRKNRSIFRMLSHNDYWDRTISSATRRESCTSLVCHGKTPPRSCAIWFLPSLSKLCETRASEYTCRGFKRRSQSTSRIEGALP